MPRTDAPLRDQAEAYERAYAPAAAASEIGERIFPEHERALQATIREEIDRRFDAALGEGRR